MACVAMATDSTAYLIGCADGAAAGSVQEVLPGQTQRAQAAVAA